MEFVKPLSPDSLYQVCDPAVFAFTTTAELEEHKQMLGQDRAVEAIELGTGLELDGFNLFVLGAPGTGRHTFIRQFLSQKAATLPVPDDWCYVNNFADSRKPKALSLPAGRGRKFHDALCQLVEEAHTAIPAAFESEDYRSRRQAIEDEAKRDQEKVIELVKQHARERGLGMLETVTGFTFVPLRNGEELSSEQYDELSDEEKEQLQLSTQEIAEELRKMLQPIPKRVRELRRKIHELDREVAFFAFGSLLEELRADYADLPQVGEFLQALQEDVVDNIELFTKPFEGQPESLKRLVSGRIPHEQLADLPAMRRYGINLLVDNSACDGAPVVFEDHPTAPYLVGQIEHIAKLGVLLTDFTLIRAGALHRANGGYLIVDVRKILMQPFAWDALKRALKSHKVDIKPLAYAYGLVSTVSLEPQAIPLDVKVVLIGDRLLYYLLQFYDPEFLELFKVAADFEDDMERSEENVQQLGQLAGTLARRENLRPLSREAVARIVEESARLAGDAQMLSTHIRRLADTVREAHYWATKAGKEVIGAEEIQCAINGRIRRASRLRDRLQREILRETILIDTEGQAVGQVNGLSIVLLGDYLFGRPNRITARIALGTGKVIDIERESKLGGPIHSKGVLILSGFLASHYITDRPLSLSATLVFEQSYGLVEGDSASAAELCALLSALAEVPIKQSLAITGSVNQNGQIQAVGGVNQKIEGFFDLCKARGLSGEQGVLIPRANVKHLMLNRELVEAVSEGKFHIFPVENIDQCMQMLTGLEAGERDSEGNFPEGSINQQITARLIELAEKRRAFAEHGKP